MFKVLLFVCSIGVPPQDCSISTALDVIDGPDASSEIVCGMHGQAFYAQTAMARQERTDEYLKVACIRTSIGKTVG